MVAFIFIVLFIGHGSEILRGVSSDDENPRVESNYVYWKSVPLGRTRCARHNRVLVPLSSPRRTKTAPIKVPFCRLGGDKGSRTPDLLHAKQALYQLSYIPKHD